MNNNSIRFLVIVLISWGLCMVGMTVKAQGGADKAMAMRTLRIGIFAPIYLDSLVTASGNFKFKESIPKFITPGLEFIHGAEIALDSMISFDEHISATIYDTKSNAQPVSKLIQTHKLDTLDLIIGSVKDIEYKQLADFALSKNIPFISVTYPNDGGITANPFLVVVNSTLKAHCEAIYSYILQNHGIDKIVLCRKKGAQEDKVAGYFKQINEQDWSPLLNIQKINFDSTASFDFLKTKLDSNRKTVIIGGSLDENFATNLVYSCKEYNDRYHNITLIGMPNWDAFKGLMKKDELEDFPIYYTTPYFNNKSDSYSKIVANGYMKKYKGKPSDMAFKGFECTYLFTKLLAKYPNDLMNHLNDKTFKLFSDYNFRPVMLKKGSAVPDYFENKHLYFIKIMDGALTKAW